MSPEDRRTLRVGVVGFVVAVALILAAWRVVASDLPDFRASARPGTHHALRTPRFANAQ